MKAFVLALLLCATAVGGDKKDKPQAPLAPLSPALTSAKTVMLKGDQDIVDTAFDELKKWGRFEVVTDKSRADLVFDFVYARHVQHPIRPGGREYHNYSEKMVVYDAKSGDSIYQDGRQFSFTPGLFAKHPKRNMSRDMLEALRKRFEQN